MALGRLLRRRELFPEPAAARVAVSAIAFAFCAVATLVILIGQVPRSLVLPLETAFGFLSLLIAGAFLRARVPARVKIGVALFALPGILHVLSTVFERMGWNRGRSSIGDLFPWGEASLILAAATAPFTLAPRRSSESSGAGNLIALVLAAVLTAAFSVALATRYALMQAIATYGPHIEMPRLASLMGLAYADRHAGLDLCGRAPARAARGQPAGRIWAPVAGDRRLSARVAGRALVEPARSARSFRRRAARDRDRSRRRAARRERPA